MGLQGSSAIFFDMAQWFSASLRQRKSVSAHCLDGLSGCGASCESGIRSQFFKILKKIVLKMKVSHDHQELRLMLNLLCWNYKAGDHFELDKLRVLEFLSQGD